MPDDPKPEDRGEPKGEMGGYRRKRRGDLRPPERTIEEIEEYRRGQGVPPKDNGEKRD